VGVPIKFSITTNFTGFVEMVNELGGIDIQVNQPMHDPDSATNFDPGMHHLNGEGALAFSRDRHSFSAGDISRTENQGYLIITALQNFQARNTGPGGVLSALGVLGRHVQMENTSLPELYRLARLVLTIDPAAIRNVVIPTGGGAGSNLSPGPGIDALFSDFRDDAILQSH
jgi:polyisoprenyl-teichoic acid--peptidoglycan teichoic acid transferase